MIEEFKLPDIGEGLVDAEIVKWLVAVGDTVELNQNIVEVETAKAVVELPCPYEGTVSGLLVSEGETVEVGKPIIAVETGPSEGQAPSERPAGASEGQVSQVSQVSQDSPEEPAGYYRPAEEPADDEPAERPLVGYGVKLGATKRRPRKQQPPAGTAAASTATAGTPGPAAPPASNGATGRAAPEPVAPQAPAAPPVPARSGALAKPPVRKLAKDLGVDLAAIAGSGPQGSVTRDDVHTAARGGGAVTPVPERAAVQREERIPIKGVRKHTAAAMVSSAFTAPHVTEFLQVDVTETMNATRRMREAPGFEGVKVSPLLFAARAIVLAAGRYPLINSSWDEAAQEIVVKHYVNLGIAAATDRGLIVPNVKDAQALSLLGLAQALGSLTEVARAGKTAPADMTGTTITITNVGVFGVDTGTPIINPGEAAILAFGQIRDLPWVVNGEIVPRKVCQLALSFDHRIVDGELGSNVLRDIGAMLEDPLRMLAWS